MEQLISNEQISNDTEGFSIDLEDDADKVKIEVMPGAAGLFNVAKWERFEDQDLEGTIRRKRIICLLGRGPVKLTGVGLPDVTPLVYRELDASGNIEFSETVFEPEEGEESLEDPRPLMQNDELMIGLTSVIKSGEKYIPKPAIVVTSKEELATGLRERKIITSLVSDNQEISIDEIAGGKNTTFIDKTTVMFRSEGPENNHCLRVIKINDGEFSIHQNDIELPSDIPWATFRAGTTMSPVWLNEHEAIFPIHGIRIDQNGRYIYSIGSARLFRGGDGILSIDSISQKPLITPDIFVGLIGTKEVELHPEQRSSVYSVSGSPVCDSGGNFQELELSVSRGDTLTFMVTIPKAKLTKGWPNSQEIAPMHVFSDAA